MHSKFQVFPKALGFYPYVWLIYISLPIINTAQEHGLKMILGYLMIGVFIISYRQLFFASENGSFSYWLALQMVIIFILSYLYNPYNVFMGFFTASFIGYYTNSFKFKLSLVSFAIIEILPIILNIGKNEPKDYLFIFPFLIIMLISPFGIRSMNKHQQLEMKLDEANERIKEFVKREERMRIARDLHDTLGHTLSLITLKSQIVDRLITKDPQRAQLEAKEIERTSRAALREVRELVSDMRAVTLVEELLEVQVILDNADIIYSFEGDASLVGVPDLTQNILSLCLREAITNIVKHSQAKNCNVRVEHKQAHVILIISDDGIGLLEDHHDGNGMKGMQERLSLMDGSITITSDKGITLRITIPIIIKNQQEEETA
ncbi:sensor histidine kinase [Paenibacillus crassostreae]|uniref:histidine kinase n=1 Tax=Paenibacillus crassostreae TaxID=1763538 RepID=A0A167GEH8_9BACL|nr:sensor histidine kinase [Paenibacillus crassostreae]AOZ92727.1 two-component sensor histidine kinase [Paenibacillus crassostreae]OAB77499.1 histidine kinase [Paenibacillus crassostreae]